MSQPFRTALLAALTAMASLTHGQSSTFEADRANASFGFGLRQLGDVNDDGFLDLAVGAHKYSNGQSEEGVVFVYLGSAGGLSTTPDWQYESNLTDARLGVSIAAGDLNGDGIDDLAAGALGYDDGTNSGGAVLIFHGSSGGLPNTPDQTLHAEQADSLFGRGLAIPGDLDDDGFEDLAVGAPDFDAANSNNGRASLYPGSPAGVATTPTWSVDGSSLDEQFGFELAGVGDVNGDGLPELAVTSRDGGSAVRDGHAEVFFGSAAGLSPAPSAILDLNTFEANTGWSIGGGDFNGDGYSDIALGAHQFDSSDHVGGAVAIFPGGTGGLPGAPSQLLNIDVADAQFGVSLAAGEDLDGDGLDDLVVGAQGYPENAVSSGAAFIFHGHADGIESIPYDVLTYGQEDARAGRRVELLGDLDGDGTSDLAVSATRFTIDQSQEGAVFVHTGFSDFLFDDRFQSTSSP